MKSLFAVAAAACLIASGHVAIAQPGSAFLATWNAGGDGSGTGDWNTASNWLPTSVPDVNIDDFAIINGGGVATISGVSPDAGGAYLGQAAGQSGTIQVTGGSVDFVNAPGFDADGGVRVGVGGSGVLDISGGSVTATTLVSGGEAGSLISLSGAASLAVDSASLVRTTRVAGPNVDFSTSGAFALGGTHDLVAEITGASHSTIDVGTTAALGGTLSVDFSGFSPSGSETWDLLNATTITGAFSSINVTGAVFGSGQALSVRSVPSGGDQLLQLFLQQQLVLDVNRATGVVTITNPGGTGVDLDGYSVRSASGAMNQSNWSTLATQLGAGWTTANPSSNALNELIDGSGSSTVAGGGALSLGTVYNPPAPAEFGTELDDVVFQYTAPGAGNIDATVQYTGAGVINDLVLYVDPSTGEATLRNTSPFRVAIEAYTITSDSGALSTAWASLEDQGADAGIWEEANPSATRVSELTNAGESSLTIHRSFDLGSLVTGGAEDLTFEYLLAGEANATTGVVVYEAAPAAVALPGDYNDDGSVDAADYTVWRDALGTATLLPGDTSPGGVANIDHLVWKNNFGAVLPFATAVPEPTAICCVGGLLTGLALLRRKSL